MHLKGRDFLRLKDFSREDLQFLIDLAIDLKRKHKRGERFFPLQGKSLGMIFEKASTRTRVSFEVGMYQLGGQALFLSGSELQIGRGEPISDTGKVLSRYLDGIMIRTFSQQLVQDLADAATIPVINGLTDEYHPCQVLADFQTIQEHKGHLQGLKLAYIGDGNNMAHSLLNGCSTMGINVAIASPDGYQPNPQIVEEAQASAAQMGSLVLITNDPVEAVRGADVIYTDVWASMGQESEQAKRLLAFAGYQVNAELMRHAQRDYLFLHCLPAHRGEEVSAEVIDGPHSAIFDEAENRLHAQKAILYALLGHAL